MYIAHILSRLMNEATGEQPSGAGGSPAAGANGAPANGAPPAGAPAGKPADGGGTPEPEVVKMTASQLKERLLEEGTKGQKKLLKDLGFEKPEDLKSALGVLKQLQDANKTEAEKAAARIKELEPYEGTAKQLKEQLAEIANEQFSALDEKWQKAIDDVAKEDPHERLRLMKSFRAQGLIGAPAAAAPAKPAAPKNVAPAGGKPPPDNGGGETAYAKWKGLQKTNSVLAGLFHQQNRAAIEATAPADE